MRLTHFLIYLAFVAVATAKDALYEPVSKHGKLSVSGVNLMNEHGEQVQLKGMSLAWSIWFPQFFNKAATTGVKNYCHSNVIRAALAVDTSDGGYLTDPEGQTKLVETVIQAAIDNDIYVIVDWHDMEAESHVDQAIKFFDYISEKYASYPNIIYETYNEPITLEWSSVVKPYHEKIIQTIRAHDPDNLIVVGTPFYSQQLDLAAADPITDQTNIMYSLHFYAATHKQYLRDIAQGAYDKGIPIFVTEYGGVAADATGAVDVDESELWYTWMNELNISFVNYDISDKDEGASALKPGTTAEQTCQEEYLSESGLFAVKHNKA